MPVYIRITDIKGDVTPAGSGNGGVWKTTNYLTTAAARSGPGGGPQVKVLDGSDGGSLVRIARISLSAGGGGVDGRDPGARLKIEQMMNSVRSQGPTGKLYIATDAGVFSSADQHGRLLVGNDQGVWRAGEANKLRHTNNLKQLGLAVHNASVDIIVTDEAGNTLSSHRMERASVSRHPNGIQVVLCDGSVKF